MGRTTTALGLAAATAALLTGCATGSTVEAAPSAPISTTTPGFGASTSRAAPGTADASSAQATVPAFPRRIGKQRAEHRGPWDLVLRDVRVGDHDGFERVVVELAGTGRPGWHARYVQTPRAEGSGEPVDVRGDAVLEVVVSGVVIRESYPRTPPDLYRGPRHFAPRQADCIADVHVGGVFEGYSQLFLGLDGGKVPFRVFALTHPSRLVVDVTDD